MAEVQRRLEAFTVEIEELSRVQLFTSEECTSLVKRFFEFENKVNSMTKSVDDFKEYISYMISLFRMIRIRRNKVKIAEKKHHLEYRVLQRVKNLYEIAITRFPQEVELFFAFFQFCKESNFFHAAHPICQKMLKHHKNNEKVWLIAARLTFHENNDSAQAIKLLQQAIGMHKSSALLYVECIKYEIIVEDEKDEEDAEYDILLKKIEIYLAEAKKNIHDSSFYIDLMKLLRSYEFTTDIQLQIVKELLKTFNNCEKTWDFLASSELDGIHFNLEENKIDIVEEEDAFCNFISLYERGLREISSTRRKALWNLYLDHLTNIEGNDKILDYSRTLISAFESASNDDCLDEKYYFTWIDLIEDSKKRDLLKFTTDKMPTIDLWALRLRIEIACANDTDAICKLFEEGCKSLGEGALTLWETMDNYHKENSPKEVVVDFYSLALRQPPAIARNFKGKYIKWLAMNDGLDSCRENYKRLIQEKPYSKELLDIAIQLEENLLTKNREGGKFADHAELEWLHKTACQQFPGECDVWVKYIKFCVEQKTSREWHEKVPLVLIEAKKQLGEEAMLELEREYDALSGFDQQKAKKRRI